MAAPAPKLDLKMLALPAALYFSRSIDFKDPAVQQYWQAIFLSVVAVCLSMYAFVYYRITASHSGEAKKIWVPPKAKPSLPFGLGPPEEKAKAEEFTETTYKDHEVALLKEAVQSLVMGCGISLFMAMQFKVYMSFLIQSISLPMGIFDNVLFKKYVLGVVKGPDGGELYHELFSKPTAQSLEIADRLAAARAAGVGADAVTPSAAKSAIAEGEPRVEELPAEETAPASQ